MSARTIYNIISNRQYQTLFINNNNINNNNEIKKILKIKKIWKKSNNQKIYYNENEEPFILLKVRSINRNNFYDIRSELFAFGLINNTNPNIVKVMKSLICNQNNELYELNKNKETPFYSTYSLCTIFSDKQNIPLSILALEYINGISIRNIDINTIFIKYFNRNININKDINISSNILKKLFKDIFIQLYCIFFHLLTLNIENKDINLDNFLYIGYGGDLDYRFLFGYDGMIRVEYKICMIDLDHVKQGIKNTNTNQYINTRTTQKKNTYIFGKKSYLYKILYNLKRELVYSQIESFITNTINFFFKSDFNRNSNVILTPLEIINEIQNYEMR